MSAPQCVVPAVAAIGATDAKSNTVARNQLVILMAACYRRHARSKPFGR